MKLFLTKSNKDEYKVAKRVLSFKKKTKSTFMNMDSKLLNNHSAHPPLSAGVGLNLEPNFQKGRGGGLDRTSTFRGVCWEKGSDFIPGECNFHIKINQNLKYLTAKRVYEQKYFSLHN